MQFWRFSCCGRCGVTDPSDQQQKKPTCYPARHTAYCFHRSWRHIHADHWVLCKILSTCQERARAETGGDKQWVFGGNFQGLPGWPARATPASLGYPPSVYNKDFTLKERKIARKRSWELLSWGSHETGKEKIIGMRRSFLVQLRIVISLSLRIRVAW